MAKAELNEQELMGHIILQVKIHRPPLFWLRRRLGIWLLVLAADVLGCGIKIEEEVCPWPSLR